MNKKKMKLADFKAGKVESKEMLNKVQGGARAIPEGIDNDCDGDEVSFNNSDDCDDSDENVNPG